jgi:hypothetical protein
MPPAGSFFKRTVLKNPMRFGGKALPMSPDGHAFKKSLPKAGGSAL